MRRNGSAAAALGRRDASPDLQDFQTGFRSLERLNRNRRQLAIVARRNSRAKCRRATNFSIVNLRLAVYRPATSMGDGV